MGNIVLSRVVIFVYVVLCLVFLITPYISGKGKRFGFKTEKSKNVSVICFMYDLTAVCAGMIFGFLCFQRNNIVFANISFILYILLMSIIYLYIRDYLKTKLRKDIFREIILNNPPKRYVIKGINAFFYVLYLIPLAFTYFLGKENKYVLYMCVLQIFIAFVSILFNLLVSKTKYYVDEDLEQSVKTTVKYRKLWNFIGFCTLLLLSSLISVLYICYL